MPLYYIEWSIFIIFIQFETLSFATTAADDDDSVVVAVSAAAAAASAAADSAAAAPIIYIHSLPDLLRWHQSPIFGNPLCT